ncbi:hypothetical protein ACFSM5_04780 [Lacibacterium aquatile]|uniref:Response regulatory domain-containing protein n=1 Tax=Lacibacterium aquatile TaxID=1168082 RepID=A0ABW5DM83_9PROT
MKNLIALIDSNAVAARGLQLSLEDGGHQVVLGSDADEIMGRLNHATPLALALAEQWNSGPRSGLAEALDLRSRIRPDMPIIVLASRFDNHDSLKATVPGLTIVLTPTEPSEILATVDKALAEIDRTRAFNAAD